ncbi:Swt1 family HEPN domain-containing protein [Trichlorobacter lovleyi]|uniref:Swt1 family HEPN domain-containing protein n=1 Tax=Trichlorobacter lovleyi TaxID=313985 RepID=UPI0024816CC2|nr:Swt1 family HEPN domain-containing protein [Trichlorobacter lovleyi]
MNQVDNYIKLFGMANLMAINDLDNLESRFDLELGHKPLKTEDSDKTYYPQFESSIREEAKKMAKHYELFYCLENAIRALINETMAAESGSEWWESGRVPKVVVEEVTKRIKKEAESGVTRRSMEPTAYTTFGELGELIKCNWELFGSIFNNQKAVEAVLSRLNTLRAPIAHCSPLAEDEVLRLQLSVRDWFRLME